MPDTPYTDKPTRTSLLAIFAVFLRLGLTSFGGPIAHLGYFRREFVGKRGWLGEDEFADLIALCQFLPGPASSQAGFAVGVARGGLAGGIMAWCGFTLPSALMLFAFAQVAQSLAGPLADAALHGLKIVAVAVVAQAVWGMARTLTPDARRGSIALAAALIVLFAATAIAQIGAIALGAAAGLILCREAVTTARGTLRFRLSRGLALVSLVAFAALLTAAFFVPKTGALALAGAFYRSGALVFGGGHVVLPLLRQAVVAPGWMRDATFLAGYGAAQAVPGPLFTIATFLGASAHLGTGAALGAAIATVAIFLPGVLILLGALPFWDSFRTRTNAQALMKGVNAAVVGILASALYTPLWTSAILGPRDFALAAAGFVALTAWRAPPVLVVAGTVLGAVALR